MAPLHSDNEIAVLTPRLERTDFSSALDFGATIETGDDFVVARGHLTNYEEETAGEFQLETHFTNERVHIRATCAGAVFVLPLVSPVGEVVEWSEYRVVIHKNNARVVCESSGTIGRSEARVFHFVPGVQAVRLAIPVPNEGLDLSLRVEKQP